MDYSKKVHSIMRPFYLCEVVDGVCFQGSVRSNFFVLTNKGIPQGKAAVMQICGDMTHCYVLHIIHSGIPDILQSLLENSTYIKVGVGIDNDSVKVFHDHNVSIKGIEDLSCLANQKLGGVPKQWSLSSLVETLTCKQLLKPKKIRLGNWEVGILSKAQLQYAATDAFASWYLYEVLQSFPDLPKDQNDDNNAEPLISKDGIGNENVLIPEIVPKNQKFEI